MWKPVCCLALLMAALMSGCVFRTEYRYETPPPVCEQPVEPVPDFAARIAAAESITNFQQKDQTLSVIARDAAAFGDLQHTLKALSLMTNFSEQDKAAETCAYRFLERQMIAEATQVANQITNFQVKDRALARIGEGSAKGSPE